MHFTTFVNILPKVRYFEGRNDIQIDYKSYSVLLFSWETYERWGHHGFLERGGILEKGAGGWSRKGGVWPPLPTMFIAPPKIAATMGYSMFSGQELEVDLGVFNFCLVRAKKCL